MRWWYLKKNKTNNDPKKWREKQEEPSVEPPKQASPTPRLRLSQTTQKRSDKKHPKTKHLVKTMDLKRLENSICNIYIYKTSNMVLKKWLI